MHGRITGQKITRGSHLFVSPTSLGSLRLLLDSRAASTRTHTMPGSSVFEPEPARSEDGDAHAHGEPDGEDELPVKRRRLTQADVPPLPARLGKNATDAEKAARTALMKERRRVQMRLQEQDRGARDRADRARPEGEAERVRRALGRLKAEADTSLLPTAKTFPDLWALTNEFVFGPLTTPQGYRRRMEKVDAAWERFLGRAMPVTGMLIVDDDQRFVNPAALPHCSLSPLVNPSRRPSGVRFPRRIFKLHVRWSPRPRRPALERMGGRHCPGAGQVRQGQAHAGHEAPLVRKCAHGLAGRGLGQGMGVLHQRHHQRRTEKKVRICARSDRILRRWLSSVAEHRGVCACVSVGNS